MTNGRSRKKRQLEALDAAIKAWSELVVDYPLNAPYRQQLSRAQQARADLANQIGRKK